MFHFILSHRDFSLQNKGSYSALPIISFLTVPRFPLFFICHHDTAVIHKDPFLFIISYFCVIVVMLCFTGRGSASSKKTSKSWSTGNPHAGTREAAEGNRGECWQCVWYVQRWGGCYKLSHAYGMYDMYIGKEIVRNCGECQQCVYVQRWEGCNKFLSRSSELTMPAFLHMF